ncbi:DUF6264 family protein [Glaciibacter sp. 2TAF33]|uniref:DUF6264 family protein n=1 Tax=Glaciibacter sp. 2TAF33 TaxID=3233015 RepID=UPI003F8F5445
MTDGTGSPPAGTPPEDRRPRPKYGELAPEGWNWKPPADPRHNGLQPTSPSTGQPTGPQPPQPAQHPLQRGIVQPGQFGERGAPGWDRPVTVGLLIFGLLGTFFTVSVLNALPQAVQMLYTQDGLGTYEPAASVGALITGGIVVQALVWLATAAISILLVVRRRRAFYVPLIGGVVAFVAIFVFMAIILASDPTLLEFYGRP